MTLLDDDLRAELLAAAKRMELLDTLRQDRPSEFYEPPICQASSSYLVCRALHPGAACAAVATYDNRE